MNFYKRPYALVLVLTTMAGFSNLTASCQENPFDNVHLKRTLRDVNKSNVPHSIVEEYEAYRKQLEERNKAQAGNFQQAASRPCERNTATKILISKKLLMNASPGTVDAECKDYLDRKQPYWKFLPDNFELEFFIPFFSSSAELLQTPFPHLYSIITNRILGTTDFKHDLFSATPK